MTSSCWRICLSSSFLTMVFLFVFLLGYLNESRYRPASCRHGSCMSLSFGNHKRRIQWCYSMIRTLLISPEKSSLFGRAITVSPHGGGTSITTTPMKRVGIFWWIVFLSTLGNAPVYSSMQWSTSIGKLIFYFFQNVFHFFFNSFPLFSLDVPHIFSLRSNEHDYVKANIPIKLLRIRTFGKLELSTFKDLISPADYKVCEKIKESRLTWCNLTADVFVKLFYKVWFMHSIIYIFQPR